MSGIEVLEPVLEQYGDVQWDPESGGLYYGCSLCSQSATHVLVDQGSKRVRPFCRLHMPASRLELLTMTEFTLIALVRQGRGVRRYDHPDGWTHIQWSGPSGHFTVDEDLRWAQTLRAYRQEEGYC